MKVYDKLYINGQWTAPHSLEKMDVINPATEEIIGQVALADQIDVGLAIKAARQAFSSWSQTSAEERAEYIRALSAKLSERADDMTQAITAELGSPLGFCREVHVLDPINALEKHADRTKLRDEVDVIGNCSVIKEAVGVCVFINPWNYPLHQMIGKLAPALAAGCTMVVKPSEMTPLHAFLLAEVIDEIGLPAGVFNLINGVGAVVGEALCTHPDVDMISFTGSTRTGVNIAKMAAPSIKRVCQELGGKSPFLICTDADLETAVKLGVDDVMYNTGQTCTALTRMLVHESQYEQAVAIAKEYAESLTVGDPLDDATFLGPMISNAQKEIVLGFIRQGIEEGARLVTGGVEQPDGLDKGYYVRPTIFADVDNNMTIAQEEIFGPVLCMLSYKDEAEALAIANDTPYGLAARVWSGDKPHAEKLARQILAGQVYINDGYWNNEAPFGGYKQSGNGREMGSYGVEEFFETKALIA